MSKSVKVVLLVFNSFVNDSRVLKEAVSLHDNDYEVKIIAHLDKDLNAQEDLFGISLVRVSYLDRKKADRLDKLFAYAQYFIQAVKLSRHSDILHCNDLNTLPIGVVVKVFFNKEVKIVYDAHEYEINDKPNQSRLSIKLHYLLEKLLIKYADGVITVSDAIADAYTKLYGIKKPALVLNTPAYQEIEKKDIFRETFSIPKEKTVYLYQGGLSRGRGIETLLDTFVQVDEQNVIVFMGYGPLAGMVQEYALKYVNIFYHEAVSPDILLDYTCSGDFGILFYENSCLNHDYCSPNKMFEYLMAEIPVIVSNLYEMKKIVNEYKIGIVAQDNSIQGLKQAIEDSKALDQEEVQEKIKKIYNWEAQEKVLFHLYKEVL